MAVAYEGESNDGLEARGHAGVMSCGWGIPGLGLGSRGRHARGVILPRSQKGRDNFCRADSQRRCSAVDNNAVVYLRVVDVECEAGMTVAHFVRLKLGRFGTCEHVVHHRSSALRRIHGRYDIFWCQ